MATGCSHLEVAVEDPLLVEVLEAEEGLGGVEARLYSGEGEGVSAAVAEGAGDRIWEDVEVEAYHLLGEHLLLAEVVEEHPARDVLGDEMELRRRLEGALEPEDEGVAHLEAWWGREMRGCRLTQRPRVGRGGRRTSACCLSTWSSIAMLSMERWRSIDALSTTFIA